MATTFDSDDLDVIEDYLSKTYSRMRLRTRGGRPQLRSRRSVLGPATVEDLFIDFDLEYAVGPPETLILGFVHSGASPSHVIDHSESEFGPGDVALLLQPDSACLGRLSHLDYTIISLEPALLNQVAAAAPGRRPGPIRLTGYRPVSPAAGKRLRRIITHVRVDILADPAVHDTPLIAAASARLLAAGVLGAFPSTARTEPTIEDRRDAHPATVRRAIAFIETDPARDISLADIAAAAYVSPRALQYAFQRHLGITPMAYLRRV